VAGIARMDYKVFFTYNVIGGVIWVGLFIWTGYLFGQLPFVAENFELVALAVVLLSVLPIVWEYIMARRKK
jgi:membrane-associated protein